MEYSDADRHANYVFLVNAILHIQRGASITEDWMEEHRQRIQIYRDFWHDMSRLNPDVQDYNFRAHAVEAETLLAALYSEVRESKTFSVSTYHRFNMCVRRMTERMYEGDIADMLSTMLKV